jgi:hypothetical protein
VTDNKELIRQAGELADSGKPDEAMDLVNRVLMDEPDNPGALFVGCVVMQHAARHVQGIQIAKRITEVVPKDPRGWRMLAYFFGELNKYDECIRFAEKCAECRRDAQSLEVLAYAYVNAGEWDKAEKNALESIKLAQGQDKYKDALRDSLRHLAYCELARKRWPSGFKGYRTTLRTKWRKEWHYGDSKEWEGEPDAVVMVTGEQGIGDEVMAASVVPDAAKACKKFILDCDSKLAALFARSFPDVIVTPTRREQTVKLPVLPTHHKSLFGLGELFRKADSDFPRKPYLVANPEYVRMFRSLLGEGVVGLAWSGGFLRTGSVQRTAGLNAFLPLIRKGGTFVSLQYKDDAEEVAEFEKQYGHKVIRLPWVTQGKDMDLLAGLLAALERVVGVHTSSLHLSSALGVPTTVLTHRGSGWRYAPDELLWYPPTTVMHRKAKGESWRECVGRL